jgi:two-component system OmpR family response regulator
MKKLELLFIDDDVEFLTMLTMLSRVAGHEITGLSNAKDAELWLMNNHPDVIVLDLVMPNLDGLELYRSIEPTLKRTTRVMFLTAASDATIAGVASATGCEVYQKPISLKLLFEIIENGPQETK